MKKITELEERIKHMEMRLDSFTEEKTAESDESVMEAIFSHANDKIMYVDENLNVLNVNERVKDIFGYERNEIIGRHASQLPYFDKQTKEEIIRNIESRKDENDFPTLSRFSTTRKDKTKVEVEVTYRQLFLKGEPKGWVIITRDITELKHLEYVAKENAEMARALLNASVDSIILIDLHGNIVDTNLPFAESLGSTVEETRGRSLYEIIGDYEKNFKKTTAYVIRSGEMVKTENEYNITPQTTIWRRNIMYPVQGPDGFVTRIAIFSQDITEAKNAEKELRNKQDQLEELVIKRTANLEEANTALKVLLEQRDKDKKELEEKILYNVLDLILPSVEKLKSADLDERERVQLELIKSNLQKIVSPFSHRLSSRFYKLTPTELEIANLIKFGKKTRDIGNILSLSDYTIQFHRANIRKKLGINNQKTNLRSHLEFLEE